MGRSWGWAHWEKTTRVSCYMDRDEILTVMRTSLGIGISPRLRTQRWRLTLRGTQLEFWGCQAIPHDTGSGCQAIPYDIAGERRLDHLALLVAMTTMVIWLGFVFLWLKWRRGERRGDRRKMPSTPILLPPPLNGLPFSFRLSYFNRLLRSLIVSY